MPVKRTSVTLSPEHYKWMQSKGYGFKLSLFLRDKIQQEMDKEMKNVRKRN